MFIIKHGGAPREEGVRTYCKISALIRRSQAESKEGRVMLDQMLSESRSNSDWVS